MTTSRRVLLTTQEVMALTGATRRRLIYWCKQGRIPGQPPIIGSGVPRTWTPEQVEAVKEAVSDQMKTTVHRNRRHGLAGRSSEGPNGGRRPDLAARQKALVRLSHLYPNVFERLFTEELEKERGRS